MHTHTPSPPPPTIMPQVCVESLRGVVQEAILKCFALQFGIDQADEFSKNDVIWDEVL